MRFKAKTLAAKSKSRRRRLNLHLNKTCRCAAGKKENNGSAYSIASFYYALATLQASQGRGRLPA